MQTDRLYRWGQTDKMDGQTDVWMDGQRDGWMDRQTDGLADKQFYKMY
jgi:hypothetical protein